MQFYMFLIAFSQDWWWTGCRIETCSCFTILYILTVVLILILRLIEWQQWLTL